MEKSFVERVVAAVRSVVPADAANAALHEPWFGGNEWKYVKECIDTGWVSSVGAFVDRFEREVAAYTGARRAIATVNGTAALHLGLVLLGVRPGDEVLMPSLTFVATANAVAYQQAVPHFCEIELDSFGLDALKLRRRLGEIVERRGGECFNRRTGRRIAALVAVHIFGHPSDVDALSALCAEFGLPLLEDAAESLGSFRGGRHTGTTGRIGTLSFNGNKVVTTGGGGMILTDDQALADRSKHLSTTAKLPHKWAFEHDQVGYNYRMPNLNAALGCAQLEQLPGFLALKRALAARYSSALEGIAGVQFAFEPEGCQSNYWLSSLLLDEAHEAARDELLLALHAAGLGARPTWTPMHQLPMYAACPRMELSVTEAAARRVVSLPSGVGLCGAR